MIDIFFLLFHPQILPLHQSIQRFISLAFTKLFSLRKKRASNTNNPNHQDPSMTHHYNNSFDLLDIHKRNIYRRIIEISHFLRITQYKHERINQPWLLIKIFPSLDALSNICLWSFPFNTIIPRASSVNCTHTPKRLPAVFALECATPLPHFFFFFICIP